MHSENAFLLKNAVLKMLQNGEQHREKAMSFKVEKNVIVTPNEFLCASDEIHRLHKLVICASNSESCLTFY